MIYYCSFNKGEIKLYNESKQFKCFVYGLDYWAGLQEVEQKLRELGIMREGDELDEIMEES